MSKVLKRMLCRLASFGLRLALIDYFSYTKQVISDLLQNRIDMSQLVITKALAKAGMLGICSIES
jgi:hypothetical protein